MIEITVKTLDSQNHQFSVDDDITVEQFKSHIADRVNIPAETQRIIYCGRVLQDASKLSEYDVNGKVVHLVHRAPPSATNPTNRAATPPPEQQNRRTGFRGFPSRNTMYVGSMAFPSNLMESQGIVPPPPSHTLSGSRLNVAKRMISRATSIIRLLEDPNRTSDQPTEEINDEEVTPVIEASVIVPGESNEQMDEQDFLSAVQDSILSATQGTMNLDPNVAGGSGAQENSTPLSSGTPQRSASPESSTANENEGENGFPENGVRTREMAQLLTTLTQLQGRLAPFLERYQTFMLDDPTVTPENYRDSQTMLNRVSEVFHYLGHAYHSLSDIIIRVRSPPPRPLLCRPILIQHSAVLQTGIPIQVEAQINFSADRPSPQQSSSNGAATATTTEGDLNATDGSTNAAPAGSGPTISLQHSMQPGIIGIPGFIPPSAVRVITPVEIRTVRGATRRTANNNNASETEPPTSTAENSSAPSGNNESSDANAGMSGGIFLPGNSNVEFLMEVTPDGVTYNPDTANMVEREIFRGAISGPPPEILQSLMHIVNNQLVNRQQQAASNNSNATSAPNSTQNSAESAAANTNGAAGQNSQARGNTGTNLTTATNTRSTPRPHVHMTQQAMQVGFDPFLPCNSHHISRRRQAAAPASTTAQNASQTQSNVGSNTAGNSNANGGQQELRTLLSYMDAWGRGQQAARQPETPAQQPAAASSSAGASQQGGDSAANAMPQGLPSFAAMFSSITRGSLPDFFRLAGSTTIHQLLQQFHQEDNYAEVESLITDLVLLLSQNLTLVDTFSLSSGNIDPLTRIAGDLSTFIRTRVCEGDTTPAGIGSGIDRILRELQPFIDIFERLPVRNDIDMPRTIERLFRLRLPIILSTALNLSATNVRELMDQLLTTVQHIFALSSNASSSGMTGVEQVLEEFMNRSMSDIPRDIRQWTLMTTRAQLRRRVGQLQVPQNILEQYIVKRSPAPSSEENNENSNDNTGSLTLTAEVESMDVEDAIPASSSVPILETIPQPIAMEDTEPIPVVLGSESWQVPEDWVPIITRDAQKQRRQNAQGPFSDSYLSGMPSKRRKLINNAKPQGTLPQVISDSVRQAVSSSGLSNAAPLEIVASAAGQSQEIQNAYRDLLRTSVQANLRENEDFTPERFPNASNYFNCPPRQ